MRRRSGALAVAGLVGVSAALRALVRAEVRLARRRIGRLSTPYAADGTHGDGADAIRLAVLGDSSAAGLGVADALELPAVLVARGLAAATGRRVELRTFAVVGAQTSDLRPQVEAALSAGAEVAVVMTGANDVTHRVRPEVAAAHLAAAVRALRAGGCAVVVGTCPDLGTVRPIAQPLRTWARVASRRLAAQQAAATVAAGGTSVPLGDLLGRDFHTRPGEMFSSDGFHPSAAGYRAVAEALLPAVLDVLGVRTPQAGDPLAQPLGH
ncbi:lysophospholipase L1-like esterase [Motilibacter rhizosphaerae]|uniref:Lysophospholipase L1-like esterase n=1 Tax=Motilibacter rhizosphaerae TaxID=598652 RepID=A0A4Q7NQ53_9ACTN|nr:SGNH/GDSL hydrolase family protein [Motilibacter rhizosphaerae]RZS87333.1 lysophospholipase L1-like esterase [Motilibacter rhizosphaerae]